MPKQLFRKAVVYENAPTAAQLKQKLAEVERAIAAANARHDELALLSLSSDEGAAAELLTLRASLTDDAQMVITLRGAIRAAEIEERNAVTRAQAAMHKSQIAAVAQHVSARNRAAVAAAEAIAALEAATRDMQAASDRIIAALPPLPSGWNELNFRRAGHLIFSQLSTVLGNELARVGHGPVKSNGLRYPHALPGAHIRASVDPATLTPMVDELAQTSKFIIDVLTGKNTEAAPVALPEVAPVARFDEPQPSEGDMRVRSIVPEPQP